MCIKKSIHFYFNAFSLTFKWKKKSKSHSHFCRLYEWFWFKQHKFEHVFGVFAKWNAVLMFMLLGLKGVLCVSHNASEHLRYIQLSILVLGKKEHFSSCSSFILWQNKPHHTHTKAAFISIPVSSRWEYLHFQIHVDSFSLTLYKLASNNLNGMRLEWWLSFTTILTSLLTSASPCRISGLLSQLLIVLCTTAVSVRMWGPCQLRLSVRMTRF